MGEFRIVRIEQIESISPFRKAALLDLAGDDNGMGLDAVTRKWLMDRDLARPPYKGHRTLQLTARGHWWAQAVLAYEADKLVAVAHELATECA